MKYFFKKNMKLEEQIYQVLDRWQIEVISHRELLWTNKQIIRMRDLFFQQTLQILEKWNIVSLYNHYNPINTDLIRNFHQNKDWNNGAMMVKIIWTNNLWPILDWDSLTQVKVLKMFNIFLEEIKNDDLKKSIAFNNWKEINVSNLIEWLSKEFYAWRLSIEEIESYQRLFFRQIKSN